jgi:hypothetical protein
MIHFINKAILTLFIIQTSTIVFGQESPTFKENKPKIIYLVKKNETSKPHYILENKKIKIITKQGEKLKGTFKISSENSIFIANQNISFEAIAMIKKPMKGLRIFGGILGSITAVLFPVGIGSAAVLIFEPFYASPLYLLAANKRFDLINEYNVYILKSD